MGETSTSEDVCQRDPDVCDWGTESASMWTAPTANCHDDLTCCPDNPEQLIQDLKNGTPYDEAAPFWRETRSREEYAELLTDWEIKRHKDAWDAWLATCSPEEFEAVLAQESADIEDDPWHVWLQNCSHAEFVAHRLKESMMEEADYGDPPDRGTEFYNRLFLIIDFLDGDYGAVEPLAKAIRWQPNNDPNTRRRFARWCNEFGRPRSGEPDPYTQLVMEAVLMMLKPKEGTDTPRDCTPQYIRLNRRWLNKRKCRVVPANDLGFASYVHWFCNEVTRIIKHEILPATDVTLQGHVPLEYGSGRDGLWQGTALDTQLARRWLEAERDVPADGFHRAERHMLDVDCVTKTSANLRALASRVAAAGVKPSRLQQQILDAAGKDASLQNYRQLAERLGRTRGTVKSAITQLRAKL